MSETTLAAAATLAITQTAGASILPSTSASITYHRAAVEDVSIFYREAGPKDAPAVVLLHGYPSSSRMYDTLIPLLADRFHLIAPDYPGFGQSEAPSSLRYRYTFDHLAETTDRLLEQLGIDRYVLFMQDYGGPVGFRIALAHPERVQAIIVQNANAYEEGLGPKWAGIAKYWTDRTGHPEQLDAFVSLEAPGSATLETPRIRSGTTPTPGPMNTRSSRDPVNGKSRVSCSTTISPTLPPILAGRPGCVSTGRPRWFSGDGTILRLSSRARSPTRATCRPPSSTSLMPATSRLTSRPTQSRR